jgi:type IV pilus assembly protein PilY1
MLHAFRFGTLEISGSWKDTDTKKARLANSDSSMPLGHEAWAFIPQNVLPYLKYLLEPGYCHIYTVDLSPFIFDASINGNPEDHKTAGSWRTILIGGMRLGGACRDAAGACNSVTGNISDCVKAPVNGNGLSSYFALDITNQNNPILLWEFSDPRLGFTTTGPAIVRTGTDKEKNGHWYVVFGSGPTGPIDIDDRQFLGRSDQKLSIFILNLKDGSPAGPVIDTGMQNAFAGSLFNASHDVDLDYQDDVLYMPYVKRSSDGTWTHGGILRVLTNGAEPSNWSVNKVVEFAGDDGGPVTTSIVRLQNQKKGTLWLYFGTGRYFFEQADNADDRNKQRRLFGIKDPCYSGTGFESGCAASLTGPELTDITNTPDMSEEPNKGWYLNLDVSGKYGYLEGIPPVTVSRNYGAERVITDPVSSSSGLVFFTTYKPYTDECARGGKSFIWAVKYNTGGYAGASLKGKALLQVSTGSIEQRDLGTTFNHADSKGGRKSLAIEGAPPVNQGLSVLTIPPPVKKVIHIRER